MKPIPEEGEEVDDEKSALKGQKVCIGDALTLMVGVSRRVVDEDGSGGKCEKAAENGRVHNAEFVYHKRHLLDLDMKLTQVRKKELITVTSC